MNILETNQKELEVYQSYRELYAAQHPYPVLGSEYSWRDGGIIFLGKMITTLAAILLAGFRTAEQFYLAASNQGNTILGWFEAILAVLAIEGLILFLAADRAKRRGKVHDRVSGMGIFLAVVISLLAGLGQSIRLIEGLNTAILGWFTIALAVGLAFASFVAYIGGEIVGQELARIDGANKQNWEKHSKEVENWEASLLSSYSRSQERKIIRADLVPNVPMAQSSTKGGTNRSAWKELSHKEKMDMAQMVPTAIEVRYGVPRRTSYNWLEQAKKYADEYVYQENK